jgi:catechol 2,3-dioxygenase-like lactoylglutathione lyase family enzyme
MDFTLELVVVPVSDVDRAKAFYSERCGFHVDVDHTAGDDFRVVQLTPPGSACSISIGKGLAKMEPERPWASCALRHRHRRGPATR